MNDKNNNKEIDYKFIARSKGPLSLKQLDRLEFLIDGIKLYYEKIKEDEEEILKILFKKYQ